MERRRVAYKWLYPCVGLLMALWMISSGSACGNECQPPQIKEGDKCVDPPAEGKEVSTEAKAEPATEPVQETTPEPTTEPPAERTAPDEPSAEPPSERSAPDEPAPPDASEPVKEAPPEPVQETTPEPSGPTPTVSIKAPTDSQVVKGEITIEVEATVASGAAIASVTLFVDGLELHKWTQPPFTYKYPTTSLKDGVHKLKAVALTDKGMSASDEIQFTSSNSGPKITFVSPKANDSVSAAFTLEVQVTSAQGIKAGSVTVEINGAPATWTQTTPSYKLTFDPKSMPYDSFPISVSAEDTQGNKDTQEIWVIHEPAAGPKKLGEECDNTDAQKRCVAGHSCLLIGAASAKSTCFKQCTVGGASSQCPVVGGKQYTCQVAFQGTSRGACVEGPPQPGSKYSPCGTINGKTVNCNTGLLCVGAQRRPDGSLISFCLQPCTTPGTTCTGDTGFICVGLTGGGGACIEQCGQKCTTDTNCSKGQTCSSGLCSTPFCQNYGSCIAIQGLSSKVCI